MCTVSTQLRHAHFGLCTTNGAITVQVMHMAPQKKFPGALALLIARPATVLRRILRTENRGLRI